MKLQDAAWASMARYAQICFAFGFELISGCCALGDAVPLPNVLWPTSPFSCEIPHGVCGLQFKELGWGWWDGSVSTALVEDQSSVPSTCL